MNGERSKINKLERYRKKNELDLSAQLCKNKLQDNSKKQKKCVKVDVTDSVRMSPPTALTHEGLSPL